MDTKTQNIQTNKVLSTPYKHSVNFYESELMLRHFIKKAISKAALESITPNLNYIGKTAANEMDALSMDADKNPPVLKKRDAWGEDVDEIVFHPSYKELVNIAAKCGMFSVKWNPEYQSKFPQDLNKMSFAISTMYAMSEMGVYCPLCMTDGVAVLIDKYCEPEDKDRLLKAIYTLDLEDLKTGAMYLTEKAGGSDVGANLVTATHIEGKYYALNGEKWFCSNANGEITFVLARTNPEIKGTKGLSIFLVEKELENGEKNPMNMIRLKDKLGVKSMASAEIILTNTVGKLVGEEFQGFKIMTQMINLSRVYNSVAALAASRRAQTEAYQFLNSRYTFGKNALQHPLIRKKLEEIGALNTANFYMVWRAVEALDFAEKNENEAQLLRLLTPMSKKWSAEKGVYITRESMELMGGIGFIEDQIMPKLMRDIMVLPIWEGAGNIMTLDMLRASLKTKGLEVMFKEISKAFANETYGDFIHTQSNKLQTYAGKLLQSNDNEFIQTNAPQFFERLTNIFQMSLMVLHLDNESKAWIIPSLNYFTQKIEDDGLQMVEPLSIEETEGLMAWEI